VLVNDVQPLRTPYIYIYRESLEIDKCRQCPRDYNSRTAGKKFRKRKEKRYANYTKLLVSFYFWLLFIIHYDVVY